MKFLGQWRNFSIRVAETEKKCPEEQVKEKLFWKENNLLFLFKILSEHFHNFSRNIRQSCQNCIQRSLGRFWGRTLSEVLDKASNFFELWARSLGPFFGKYIPGLPQLHSGGLDDNFAEKHFFQKNFVFCINFGAPVTFSLGK